MDIRPSPRVFATDWRTRGRSAWPAAICLFVAATLDFVGSSSIKGWLWGLLVVGLLFLVPNLAARVNALLVVSVDEVKYRSVLRITRRCPRSVIRRAIHVKISVWGRYTFARLLLVDNRNTVLLSIQEEWWPPERLSQFVALLNVPVSEIPGTSYSRRLNREFPGAASFVFVHRVAFMTCTLALVLVLVFGIIGALTSAGA